MARRRRGRAISGILVLDKPRGLSSNAALQRVKRLLDAQKAGHTGSLDPMATGVLPLCFGEATKVSQYLLDADKGYSSTFILGVATDTGDAEGEIKSRADASNVSEADVLAAMATLTGDIEQIPPMYSALKHQGKPLYALARQGVEIKRTARKISILQFDLLKFIPGQYAEIEVDVRCSKGTYIRVLAEDLGAQLGLPCHVSRLRRTISGPFALSEAVSIEQLEAAHSGESQGLDQFLVPIESALAQFPPIFLSESASFYLQQGQPVLVPNGPRSGMVRIADQTGAFLGIGEMLDDGRVAPRRLIATA